MGERDSDATFTTVGPRWRNPVGNEETPPDLTHATDNAQPYEQVTHKQNKTANRFVDHVGPEKGQGNPASSAQVSRTENISLTQMGPVEQSHSGPVNEM